MEIKYFDYLQSLEWRVKADAAKRLAGFRCQVCNSPNSLNAHHRTYERIYHEEPQDITVLCEECHDLFHRKRELYIRASREIPPEYQDIIKK